jgi:phosphatidylglycerophosphate synthase
MARAGYFHYALIRDFVKKTPFLKDYALSLKEPCAEEFVDLIVFRPLGYLCVKMFLPFPITPNQVSGMAMIIGIAAGFFLTHGTHFSFVIGGMLYGLSNILDCCDGMLARTKKNGTATGRIVDGVVDYITGGAVFIGLGIGLTKAVHSGTLHLPSNAWLLVVMAAASTAFHAVLSDYYRNTFLEQRHKVLGGDESELEKYNKELIRLNAGQGHAADKMLIRLYLGYLRLQAGNKLRRKNKASSPVPIAITPANVILWNCIGPSTHITFFILASVLFSPEILFYFTVILANIWALVLCAIRIFENTQLRS